jgi:hypothetical protein
MRTAIVCLNAGDGEDRDDAKMPEKFVARQTRQIRGTGSGSTNREGHPASGGWNGGLK